MRWALVGGVAVILVIVRIVVRRRQQEISLGSSVTPQWINENVYRRDGDKP